MTFEERLGQLTERHEALTQTVELLVAEQRQIAAEMKDGFRKRDREMEQVMEGMARLLHIAEIHDRLERLEGD